MLQRITDTSFCASIADEDGAGLDKKYALIVSFSERLWYEFWAVFGIVIYCVFRFVIMTFVFLSFASCKVICNSQTNQSYCTNHQGNTELTLYFYLVEDNVHTCTKSCPLLTNASSFLERRQRRLDQTLVSQNLCDNTIKIRFLSIDNTEF